MLGAYMMLGAACLAFVGSHFLMSHPLRRQLVWRLGASGFALVYSAISLALFYWMVVEFNRAPKGYGLWHVGDILWAIASVVTLLAAILFVGSFVRNPSFPGVPDQLAAQEPFGVFRVTRHPMMWGFAFWGMAHIVVAPRADNFIFAGSIIFLALVGAKAQEVKKARLMGVEWDAWLRKTHYVPRLSMLHRVGFAPWIVGGAFWALSMWGHPYLGVAGAGIFRWL
jgi:uncharacterized membrane protein